MTEITVTKRDGSIQSLDLNKIHTVLTWAIQGLENVFISEIETKSGLQFYHKISTKKIHDILIDTASKLITEDSPDYQYVASKLMIMKLRKEIYNSIEPLPLYSILETNTKEGVYDASILSKYSKDEIDYLDSVIDHNKDFAITYSGLSQFVSKYLVKNKVTKKIYETPQIANMLVAMVCFINYEPKKRLEYVEDFYSMLSDFRISLPTPIMAGLRTSTKQFSSCVLIDCADSLDGISATIDSILQYSSRRAGIGLNIGRIRALGSQIRSGEAYHTGVVPFIKVFEQTLASCNQGGIRKGSATLFYPIWHLEIEDLIVLKNNKGTDETRARNLDYSVQINKLFYERLINKENITLFSPSDVPGLYEAFFKDQNLFKDLYLKYEKDKSIRKQTISADELFSKILTERLNTGRIYIMNVDHCNQGGPFIPEKAPIYSSNLCMEILLRTAPVNKHNPDEGLISLCTLGGVNLGKLKKLEDLEHINELLVRALDAILTYQDYPLKVAAKTVLMDRALGVGVINYAYFLAKNKVIYGSQEALDLTHSVFEHFQYYLLKASNKLAKEFGSCDSYSDSKYSLGSLPIDRYSKSVDEITSKKNECDWESLRSDIKKYGLRNNVVSALFPAETSATLSNSTPGVEMLKDYVTVKTTKEANSTFIPTDLKKLKSFYRLAWDIPSDYHIRAMAVMQKFIDQSISTNTYYNPKNFPEGKISITKMKRDLLLAYKYGLKTVYYCFTPAPENQSQEESNSCSGGACAL